MRKRGAKKSKKAKSEVQLELDFDGFAALRKWLTDDDKVKHLLRVIWDHIRKDDDGLPIRNYSWMRTATLCREMSVKSPRTVQKAISKAVKLGYLIVHPPGTGPAFPRARNCNTFQLRFAELRDAADLETIAETLWNADHDFCRTKRFKSLKAYIDFLRFEGVEPEELSKCTPANSAGEGRKFCGGGAQILRGRGANSAPRNHPETNPETNPTNQANHESEIATDDRTRPEDEGGKSGVCKSGSGKGKPGLRNVQIDDLKNPQRFEALFSKAVRLGLIGETERERRWFYALREHALRIGTEPPALFASNVNEGNWKTFSDEDEDRARKILLERSRAARAEPIPHRQTANESAPIDGSTTQTVDQVIQDLMTKFSPERNSE